MNEPERVTTRTRWQRFQYGLRYALALLGGLTVAGVGDYMSFRNLMTYAHRHHFASDWGLPVGLDAAIPALLLLDSLRPSRFLRAAAFTLSGITVFANAAVTPDHSWVTRCLHGLMPAIAIIWYEAVRRLNRTDADKSKMDKVRWLRYLVSPVRTVRLRFRMIRWELTSYAEALRLESAILLARAVLVSQYGARDWRSTRRRVPVILRHQLDTGQLPPELFFAADWTVEVRAWVRATLDDLSPAHPPVPAKAERSEPDPSQFPAAAPRDPWEPIWELRDRLVPEGISPELFVKAYAVARNHLEQVGQHITVGDMRDALGIRKDRAGILAKLMRTAYETGPVRMLQERDLADRSSESTEEPNETVAEPDDTTGPYERPFMPAGGA